MVYEHDEPVETAGEACGWGRGLARGVGRQNSMAKLDGSSGIGKRSVTYSRTCSLSGLGMSAVLARLTKRSSCDAMCDLCDETFFHS